MCSGLWSQSTSYPLPVTPALFCLFKFYLFFIYFWWCWLFIAAQVVVQGLLIAMASFVAEHGL